MDQAASLRERVLQSKAAAGRARDISTGREQLRARPVTKVITVSSGKGGVGKTNIVANLAFHFTKLGKKVLILDADFGLGNIDILLGLSPKYYIEHLISGDHTIDEVMIEGPNGMKILPSSSGMQSLVNLTKEQKRVILGKMEAIYEAIDVCIIDTGAGISSNVTYFGIAADEIIVVVSPEPTSVMDAYALIKVINEDTRNKSFNVLINSVASGREADEVFANLVTVSKKFLNVDLKFLGFVPWDKNLRQSVKEQRIVSQLSPFSESSRAFQTIAQKLVADLMGERLTISGQNGLVGFFKRFFGKD